MPVPIARALGALVVVSSLALPAAAHAEGAFDPRDPRTGVQLGGFVGAGWFTSGGLFPMHQPWDHGIGLPSVGAQAELGYRFVPAFSAGVHGTFQLLGLYPGGIDSLRLAGAGGVYVRIHPLTFVAARRGTLLSRLDLHVSIGFDPIATVHDWSPALDNHTVDRASAGVAMPVSVGLDYALGPSLSLGLLAQGTLWTAESVCFHVTPPGELFPPLWTYDHVPEGYLFLGIGLRGTFNVSR